MEVVVEYRPDDSYEARCTACGYRGFGKIVPERLIAKSDSTPQKTSGVSPDVWMANPPVLWDIDSDPKLAGPKLFAEAWDAAGLHQVGSFVGDSWREWNGRFRDDVQSFRGDDGSVTRVADRLLGSSELYSHKQLEAEQSVNFVTCRDGFTLNDHVSYNQKHYEVNGEGNRDGSDDNRSWNCGVLGPSDNPGWRNCETAW